MRPHQTLLFLLTLLTFASALALPSWSASATQLFKRKGGGGGKGGSGSKGGSSSSSSSSSSSPGRTSSTSNGGGSTSAGSGPVRGYGGGAYYGGGSAVPYKSGTPTRGVSPYLYGGAALAFFPGLWLYSVYAYSWPGTYYWRNYTNNANETGPVQCLCEQYQECGCDYNNNTDYLSTVANNGSVAYRAENGTLYINGTLPNGTTAPGGEGAASSLRQGMLENSGYWFVVAGVTYAVSML